MGKSGLRLRDVTDANLGVWIEGSSVRSPIEFSIAIVDLAVSHGFEINTETWERDKPTMLGEDPEFDLIEDLGFVTDAALDFLNGSVPRDYYFDFEDGLCLFKEDYESDSDSEDDPAV
jgi:hypothetical protein